MGWDRSGLVKKGSGLDDIGREKMVMERDGKGFNMI